ncbi:MAG TPA: efflux RND transporter periplasmic adaptor subunit, partial [Terriglobia bacterium]|nr:efflux RND transporter periplasmic adaptor subunit [Terriglobia bacterium]
MKSAKIVLLVFLGSIVLTGCGTSSGTAATSDSSGRGKPAESLRKVTTVTAVEMPLEQLIVVTGTLGAEQEIILGMKVAGRISDLPVDLGSTVQKGDVIARLDTTDFELRVRQSTAALEQARVRLGLSPSGTNEDVNIEQTAPVREARANMDGAKARLDRAAQLYEKGLMAKADFDVTNSAYKVTEAHYADALDEARNRQGILSQRRSELEIARQQLADAILYAPIGGAVRQRSANVGQYVSAGAPIVTLVQMSPLRLRTDVPEREALNIRSGMLVRVTVEGTSTIHEGRVVRLSPSVDEANRTLLVETEIPNTSNALRPGSFARAEIVASSSQRGLIVPAAAVVSFAGIDRVFTVRDGKVSEIR